MQKKIELTNKTTKKHTNKKKTDTIKNDNSCQNVYVVPAKSLAVFMKPQCMWPNQIFVEIWTHEYLSQKYNQIVSNSSLSFCDGNPDGAVLCVCFCVCVFFFVFFVLRFCEKKYPNLLQPSNNSHK